MSRLTVKQKREKGKEPLHCGFFTAAATEQCESGIVRRCARAEGIERPAGKVWLGEERIAAAQFATTASLLPPSRGGCRDGGEGEF